MPPGRRVFEPNALSEPATTPCPTDTEPNSPKRQPGSDKPVDPDADERINSSADKSSITPDSIISDPNFTERP